MPNQFYFARTTLIKFREEYRRRMYLKTVTFAIYLKNGTLYNSYGLKRVGEPGCNLTGDFWVRVSEALIKRAHLRTSDKLKISVAVHALYSLR